MRARGVAAMSVAAVMALAVALDARSVELSPCRLEGLASAASCGHVSRPLDPARPQGPRIDVHFAVLPAISRAKRPDPVLLLAGGPGQSAIDLAGTASALLSRARNRRDLVLVDVRGTGRSAALDCPGDRDDPAAQPLAHSLDPARRERDLVECREWLSRRAGTDLRLMSTALAAGDVEAVRESLGVAQWNLVGISYGTRLALELMRQSPGSVRRAVLDGVVLPDHSLLVDGARDADAALAAVWTGCEAEPGCSRRHPALQATWTRLLAALPRPATVAHPRTGSEERLTMTREAVVGMVRTVLYQPPLAAALPEAITAAAEGRFGALVGLAAAATGGARRSPVSSGLHFSVVCGEDPALAVPGPTAVQELDGVFAASVTDFYRAVCTDWPRATLPAGFGELPGAGAPVLALSGGLDPVTPPRHGERLVGRLGAAARHLVVPHAGHGVLAVPCVRDAVFAFIDAADAAAALGVPTDCAATMPRPRPFEAPQ